MNRDTSLKFKGLQIPTVKRAGDGTQSASPTKKVPGENLKQKLASAMSAKLAATNKAAAHGSSLRTTANTRSIEYLLQRKQQNDNKLNTKSLSLQQPSQVTTTNNEPSKEELDKQIGASKMKERTTAQKSLLNALMSGRMSSGNATGKQQTTTSTLSKTLGNVTKTKTEVDTNENRTNANKMIENKSIENEKSENGNGRNNLAKTLPPKILPKPNRFSKTSQENKNSSQTNNRPLNTSNGIGITNNIITENINSSISKLSAQNNKGNGVIKHSNSIRNANITNNEARTHTTDILETPNKITSLSSENGKDVFNERKLSLKLFLENRMKATKNVDADNKNVTRLKAATIRSNNDGSVPGNKFILEKEIQQKRDEILRNRRSSENLSKQIKTPAVAPKPVPKIAPKPNMVTRTNSRNDNSNNDGNEDLFQESVLEQLESDISNCKIATFKTMEDFSVLRMRIFRLQNEVELLKQLRENRTT